MDFLSFWLVTVGALILSFSMVRYRRTLVIIREQTYDMGLLHSLFNHAAFTIMVFSIIGYIFLAFMIYLEVFDEGFRLVFIMLFWSAVFTFCMVKVQAESTYSLVSKNAATINIMIAFLEAKDTYTKGHSEHVFKLANLIYQYLPAQTKAKVDHVKLKDAAILHDIGKILVPDGILDKSDELTEEEWVAIRQHPNSGKNILEKTTYRDLCEIIQYHHERMDGEGYYGIPAGEIPIESKIISVADTFSALYADRAFRKRYPFLSVIEMMKGFAGTQLDTELVDVFCNIPEAEIERLSIKPVA